MSLKEGNFTARGQYQYRTLNDARIPVGLREGKPIMLPDEAFTYGKRNRPATPVNQVLSNFYGETAGAQLQDKYAY